MTVAWVVGLIWVDIAGFGAFDTGWIVSVHASING